MSSRDRKNQGFTLIEIMVVVVVIAILAATVSPLIFRNVADARQSAAKSQIQVFGLSLDAFRLDNDRYPSTGEGLQALRFNPDVADIINWRGPYVRKEIPLDPWRRPYIYRYPGEANPAGYDLISYGRDGEAGGTDEDADIESWR